MNRLQNLQANKPALQKQPSVRGADEFGRKGPQFLTMTRADFAAYEYLCRQAEAKEWIQTILGKELPDADLWKSLGNGVFLCELANAIWPKEHPVKRIHPVGSFSFKLIENIDMFLNAISSHGMPKTDLFTPTDLFEKKNMPFVLNTLYKLSNQIEKEGFTVHWNKIQNLDFSPKEIQEAKKLEGVNLWEKKGAKNVSEEEKKAREEAERKRVEEEKAAQEELEKQRKAQEDARLKAEAEEKARQEEEARKAKEEEEKKKKEEEDRAKALAALEALKKKEKEEYEAMKKKLEEEEERRKDAAEHELKRRKMKEEEDEVILQTKYGGKSNLDKIRKMLGELEKMLEGEDGNTALHVAVEKQMEEVVKYLLEEEKVDPNKPNGNHDIPLHIASAKDNNAIVQLLIKHGSNVNTINRDGNTPLHLSAREGKLKQCEALLSAKAQVNARNMNLDTALILATQNKHEDVVELLIKHGADVNAHNKHQETALHIAAEQGSLSYINKLHASGTLVLDPRNKDNATPLHIAAENKHFSIVKRLVELGAKVDTKKNDGWSPLYTAAYNGDTETAVLLLSKGADVDGANEEGWAPLHAACAQGHTPVAKVMIEDFKAKVNIMNEQGTTPFFHAVSAGRRSIADYLVAKGADIDLTKEEGGWRPIHAACYNEFKKLTNFLVEKGARLDCPCKDIKGYTPLQILISTEDAPDDLIELLIKKGPKCVDMVNENGGTALHLAVFWDHFDITKMLVENGAKMDIKNDRGRTPLDLAGLYGHEKIADFLSKKSGVKMPEMKNQKRVMKDMATPNEPPQPDKA